MSSAVETGFAQSEALQKEWDTLKREMDRLVSQLARRPNEKQSKRKAAVEERMNAITKEMATVLSKAQKEVPNVGYQVPVDDSDSSIEEEDQGHIQHDSKRTRAPICRTYDSTESEPEEDDAEQSASALREIMLREARANDPTAEFTTVGVAPRKGFGFIHSESRADNESEAPAVHDEPAVGGRSGHGGGAARLAAGKFSKLRGLKHALGMKHASKPRELTEDERDSLQLESSRLERRARKLKKKQSPSPNEAGELSRILARLAEISKELESGLTTRPLVASDDEDTTSNSSNTSLPAATASPDSIRSPQKKALLSGRGSISPRKGELQSQAPQSSAPPCLADAESSGSLSNVPIVIQNSDSEECDPVEDEHEYEAPKSKAIATLGQSVMSLRAFGRQKKNALAARLEKRREAEANPPSSDSAHLYGSHDAPPAKTSSSSFRSSAVSSGGSGNPYVEVTDKLAQRGEKLGALSKGADEMTENASEMMSAAAALRKRQQKSNGFFR